MLEQCDTTKQSFKRVINKSQKLCACNRTASYLRFFSVDFLSKTHCLREAGKVEEGF